MAIYTTSWARLILNPSKCLSFLLNPVFHVVAVKYSHLIANKSLTVLFGKLSHRTVNASWKRTMGNSVSSKKLQRLMAHLLIEEGAAGKETLGFMLTLASSCLFMFANHLSEKTLLLQSVVADNQKYLMIILRERESPVQFTLREGYINSRCTALSSPAFYRCIPHM